ASKLPSAAATIGSDALIRNPYPLWRLAALPEHVDRHAAAREPVAADSEPSGLEQSDKVLADAHCAILMEGAVIAEAGEIKLQRLRFDNPSVRRIVDDQMRKIGLPCHRTHRRELGRGEAGDIIRIGVRIGDA